MNITQFQAHKAATAVNDLWQYRIDSLPRKSRQQRLNLLAQATKLAADAATIRDYLQQELL